MRLIIERRFGEMICYRPPHIDSVAICDAVQLSRVELTSPMVVAARAIGMSFGDYPADHSPFVDLQSPEERVDDLLDTARPRQYALV